jgi:predicted metal-dependent phosphoesterase TrpH
MLKVDLHLHSKEDPRDVLDYDARELIRVAAGLNFDALALTLHGKVLGDKDLDEFAADRGVLLIPGIEKCIHHKEVLVYNATQQEMDAIHTFEDLRQLKIRKRGQILIVAPHPFFKRAQCLGRHLEEHIDLFDGIEYCHLYTQLWNLNARAVEVARSHGKPMIATSDAHALWMFGKNFSWVDSPQTIEGIFNAVRAGHVRAHCEPMTPWAVVYKLGWAMGYHNLKKLLRPRHFSPPSVEQNTPENSNVKPETRANPTVA